MIILPAIDLKDGHCVRLRQGRADDVTVYADDPVAQALDWRDQGAEQLHVVDLDGAFQGAPQHTAVIERIVQAVGIPVEVGGGLRSDAHVEQLLAAGVARAIIGTRALENIDALAALVQRFGDAIAVGIDARDGFVPKRRCLAGKLHIDPNGDLFPCYACHWPDARLGNISDGLRALLSDKRYVDLGDCTVDSNPKCGMCDYRYLCGGACLAWQKNRPGSDYNVPVPDCTAIRSKAAELYEFAVRELRILVKNE